MNMKIEIARLNDTPMERLRFRDFLQLKVPGGRDQFSNMRTAGLQQQVEAEQAAAVVERFTDPRVRDVAMRWILRGLETDRAIRKALTDWEIGNNAVRQRRTDDWRSNEAW